jgi:RNA polymerase sigma factor (sigma-70 family)
MTADSANALARQLRTVAMSPGAGETDDQLLGRFVAHRDESAFAELVRRHGPMVLGVCRRVLTDAHDAEDAFQATFLVLARKARSLADQPSLGAWLYGVAHRAALKAKAMAARRRAREAAVARPEGVEGMAEPSDVLAIIELELGRLPKKYREALVLCVLCGRPRKEVAEQLGVPEGTLASRLAKAREMLAARLHRRGLVAPAAVVAATTCDAPTRAAVPSSLADAAVKGATGTVPAAVGRIASEVTRAMFLNKFRTGAFLLAAVALASAAGLTTLSRGAANPTGAPVAAPTPGAVPTGRTADEPGGIKEKVLRPAVPAWKKEFEEVYRLKDGEVVKRIAPPFPACREEYARAEKYLDEDSPFGADDLRMMLRWDGKRAGNAILTFSAKGPIPPSWFTVGDLVHFSAGSSVAVEGDPALLKAYVTGDFVVRDGAPAEKLVPGLESILRDECELPVKVRLAEVEREVVVARGKFESRPRDGRQKNEIDVFSRHPIPGTRAGGGSGDLARFLLGVEAFTRRRIVSEVDQPPTGTLSWYFHRRAPATAEEQAADTDAEAVFKTVAAQTGLTFTTTKKKVPVIFVERVKK